MKPTELLYLSDMSQLVADSSVLAIETDESGTTVILDQTVFYPQGGGQPADHGTITSENGKFTVTDVRFIDGIVRHLGTFSDGEFVAGDRVTCSVDERRRNLLSRIHSAGHVVDMAVDRLGYDWTPVKGYHFPDGPYVKYDGSLNDEPKEEVIQRFDQAMAEIMADDAETSIKFADATELPKLVRHAPENIPTNKPTRVVFYGDFGVPCGGTHVAKLSDIGNVTVRKLKTKSGEVTVAYEVSQ